MDISLSWIFSQWALFVLGIGIIIYLYGIKNYSYFQNRNVPFIKPKPFLGNTGCLIAQTMSFPDCLIWMYNEFKGKPYGGVFQFRKPIWFLRDPDLIKTITIKDFDHFTDHSFIITEDVDPLWGKGMFNLQGQRWKDMRTILTPAFTSSKMKNMFVLVDECGTQLINFLEKCHSNCIPDNFLKIEKEGEYVVVELKNLFTRYTNDVIATAAFGVGVDSLMKPSNEFYLMGKEATSFKGIRSLIWMGHGACPSLMKLLDIPVIPKSVKNYFRSLIIDTMATREEKGIMRPDLVQLLMQAKKGTLQDESNPKLNKRVLEDDDLVAQAFLFFFAGFDTTSTLLCFACHQLAVHPEVMSKLQDEIDAAVKENGGNISYETIHSMKYLDMVISETLRLYPPSSAVDRRCVKKYTLPVDPRMELMPDDGLWIPIYAIHRDPEHFPNPDTFDPERFSDENKHNIKPFTFIPFGVGPRNCIGSRFALMECKIALAKLLQHFNLKVVPRTPIPIKISKKGFSMTVDEGFWMGLEKRNTKNSHCI